MTDEKRKILDKIDELITIRKNELLKELPSVHEVDDGIILRFFTEWNVCEDDNDIKYKKIKNIDNPDESIVFFFIPKGSFFDLKQKYYIGYITCLNGRLDLNINNISRFIDTGMKICVESNEVQGLALENSYIITTSNRNVWSQETLQYVKEHY